MSDDKPFLCSAPGCGQRFTNEEHLAVHEHKHEMTVKFGPARDNSVIVADQTPTPTCFLKNCEEVGLFNELTSPMEQDFKIAAVDDMKKMPLDLSPLATPMIIQNKIEDHSAVAAHRGSPLPHPESTTRDDKPSSLPSSTVVHPASLQVPNVLLATSDASVVIQQVLPSPTSSSVITQASSSKRPIVPVSGTFPVLFQLPNGQTMPVAIPATIASSLHIPTGIPKLKAVVSQQLPQVTSGDAGVVQSSAVTHTAAPALAPALAPSPGPDPSPVPAPPVEPCPQPLHQPATSTTASPAQHTTTTGGRQRRATSEDPDEKRRKFLERNRGAVSRCRQKRKVWVSSLEKKAEDLNSMNGQLQNEVTLLRNEVDQLKHLLLAHKDCPVTTKKKKSAYHTSEEDSYEEMSVPDSLQSEAIQHSSVSISNRVSTSSMTPAASAPASAHVPTTASQSTEEDQPQGGAALFTTQTQPSGS
ncbi:cyclic AMP-dependent transcription factor ATF-2 isoform X2 [Salmo salar]|uniref:Cyclic AMP-dependent transcription factor ATF-2 isoform X2 n=1 Tax=Salmo salar TaxID=8030 RepID=A0ABM3DPT8_SALSA|nr:cyclic AMP-dependent transcription factor ATF-2-like isoform X2 [Salmo salar]